MNSLVEDIKENELWQKIHSEEEVSDIIEYFKKTDINYDVIDLFLEYLNENFGIDKNILTSKFLISIFMISKFPEEIIGTKLEDKEKEVLSKASEIYNKFVNNDLENINKKLVTFKIIFNDWKKKDKYSQMNILCEMYYKYTDSLDEYQKDDNISDDKIINIHKNITDTMDDEDKAEFIIKLKERNDIERNELIDQINKMRNKILHSLKELSPQYKVYLNNYKLKNVKYDETVYKHVYTKMKQVYWENIKADIFEKQNTEIYKHIITDYLELLEDINITDLDTSAISSFKDYEVSEENLLDACVGLCKMIIKCNMKIDSENYDEIYEMLLVKLDNKPEFIADIFKLCFNRLETIKDIKITISKKRANTE